MSASSELLPAGGLVRGNRSRRSVALFEAGFRPFFLLAGLYAVAPVVAWLLAYTGVYEIPTAWGGLRFHAHEMIFGFALAAVAGFLLTAVPNWTGTPQVRGAPLLLAVGAWLAGRAGMWASASLSPWAVAVADLALPFVLVGILAPRLLAAKSRRNYVFLALLLLFGAANLLTHLETAAMGAQGRVGVLVGAQVLVVMILVVGGRIVPAFTENALRRRGIDVPVHRRPRLVQVAVGLTVLSFATELFDMPVTSAAAGLAAGLGVAAVLSGWGGFAARRDPLVLVLHLGYGFVALGLAARGAVAFGAPLPGTAPFHLLSAGAMGTMILAVMSRASLGHTGRPLEASRALVAAYACVVVGALVRCLGPVVAPTAYVPVIVVGGLLWALGYVLFVVVFSPILLRPRVDGRPG